MSRYYIIGTTYVCAYVFGGISPGLYHDLRTAYRSGKTVNTGRQYFSWTIRSMSTRFKKTH